ncbi:MAG: MaoC family dehydratase [Methylocella sp.]
MPEAAPGAEHGAAPADWPKLGETIGRTDFGPFAPEQLSLYAEASGDDNPLHLDAAIAAAVGLAAPPIHGMLMMSCFEPALRRWRGDIFISKLSGKFLRPISVGAAVTVTGRVARASVSPQPELVLRLMAHGPNGDLAILAEATVRPADAAPG